MPIYDYKCPKCGNVETLSRQLALRDVVTLCDQMIETPDGHAHEVCHGILQRQISAPSVDIPPRHRAA